MCVGEGAYGTSVTSVVRISAEIVEDTAVGNKVMCAGCIVGVGVAVIVLGAVVVTEVVGLVTYPLSPIKGFLS